MPTQLDLLVWGREPTTVRFEDDLVRSPDPASRMAMGVATALRDAAREGNHRSMVAARVGELLGQPMSVNVLNAYASPAREGSAITAHRYAALAHATRDRRLLELLAEPCGWTVIDRRLLRVIELAALGEQQRDLRRQAAALRRQTKSEGLL